MDFDDFFRINKRGSPYWINFINFVYTKGKKNKTKLKLDFNDFTKKDEIRVYIL
jgi:hypothetical protein